jgi:putative transposase
MRRSVPPVSNLLLTLASDLARFVVSVLRPRTALVAENLFLRKQLAFYREHKVTTRPLTDVARLSLVLWSRWFEWKEALLIVKPETLITWHRKGFKLFWRWKSRRGRPPLPREIRELIVRMAGENPTWGQARVAAELLLKLAIWVSPRTVRKYWPCDPNDRGRRRNRSQRWATFVHNHANGLLACDFLVVITARFHLLYVLVILELGSRRILHCNVTAHPTAEWTLQQFREALPSEHGCRYLIHDHDSIFSPELDKGLSHGFGLNVLRIPPQSPQANAHCERLIGTIRRECLDWVIPLHEKHLRKILLEWVAPYNQGQPHASLGPGIPAARHVQPDPNVTQRHRLHAGCKVIARSVLGGLHHEYRLESAA